MKPGSVLIIAVTDVMALLGVTDVVALESYVTPEGFIPPGEFASR